MDHAEPSWSYAVAIPLIDEFAGLIQMNHARGAQVVGGVAGIGVIGAFVRMTFADVDIAIWSEGEVERLPEKPLPLGFIPVASFPFHAEGHEKFPLGTEFHHRRTVCIADPHVVL